jgi:hypothetical protein
MIRWYIKAALRWQQVAAWCRRDGGYSTETAVWTAILGMGAIVVAGIIIAAVTDKANSINLDVQP